jgi:hypothetical protein
VRYLPNSARDAFYLTAIILRFAATAQPFGAGIFNGEPNQKLRKLASFSFARLIPTALGMWSEVFAAH